MASTVSAEAKELALIDKVEFRIALADTDAKLQAILKIYLTPLLVKLGTSEHVSVKTKVVAVTQHIDQRIKPQSIELPVQNLIQQYKDNPSAHLVRHFDLYYAQVGMTRLPASERAQLLPTIVKGIAATSDSIVQNQGIFNLLLRSLVCYALPPKGSPNNDKLKEALDASAEDVAYLSEKFGQILLLSKNTTHGCSGLSIQQVQFLNSKPETFDPSTDVGLNLGQVKAKVLDFLASGLFNDDERLFPVLFATGDPNSRICDTAEEMLKRLLPSIGLDDEELVRKLYAAYFGSRAAMIATSSGMELDPAPSSTVDVPPLSIKGRARIISLLSKTAYSAKYSSKIIRLVEEDLLQDFQTINYSSKPDREVAKLRAAIVNFLHFLARSEAKADLDEIAGPVIRSLKIFAEQGAEQTRSPEIRQVRGNSFEIIGLLATVNADVIVEPELTLLRWLFTSLGSETDKELLVSIDQALSTTLRCFQVKLDPKVEKSLQDLLLFFVKQTSLNSRNVRYVAVRFANCCLPFDNLVARYIDICILGKTSEIGHETIEEAKNGMNPYWTMLTQDIRADAIRFPKFVDLIEHIFWDSGVGTNILAVTFALQTLLWEALSTEKHISIEIGPDWDRLLELTVSENLEARTLIRGYMARLCEDRLGQQALMTLCNAALTTMNATDANVKQRVEASKAFAELCTLLPEFGKNVLSSSIIAVAQAVLDNDDEIRSSAAKAYGLLASQTQNEDQLVQSLHMLHQKAKNWVDGAGARINQASGSLLALSSFIAYRLYTHKDDNLAKSILEDLLPLLLTIIEKSSETGHLESAFRGLGQLAAFRSISLVQITSRMPVNTIIDKVFGLASSGNEIAIAALGDISLIFDEGEGLEQIINKIHTLHEIKQIESQFAVGEALVCAACGWECRVLVSKFDIDGPAPTRGSQGETFQVLIERVFEDSKQPKTSLRKASILWLLCFLQYSSGQPEIQSQLQRFHIVFKRCLADNDDLIQESASRGLALVYENGSVDLKDNLVRDLVGTFSNERADTTMSGTVDEGTTLFVPGALPTENGASVSTYKDIMSLASEVGDSSLTYRFMQLASSNALWSSRAAFGRFGLSNVLLGPSMNDYVTSHPKLVPKLYRYRFDPNSKVRGAMNDIWKALVPEGTTTVEKQFDAIMTDLIKNILAREWRTRQACCSAMADLVSGKKEDMIAPYLDKVWKLCFKVLDDIKGSVQEAAAELFRVLIGILIRTLESQSTGSGSARKMLENVLPFLFSHSGLDSKSKEVQAFSFRTVIEVIKKAHPGHLRPFVPGLVESILVQLTNLEPDIINHLQLNHANLKIGEGDIDKVRIEAIRRGSLWEAIETCLDGLDEGTMVELSKKVQETMKSAVGVPTKIGCAQVIVSLSTRRTLLFKPHADAFLRAISKYLVDRNDAVMQSYAAAMGYAARGASDDAVNQVAAFARRLYFEKGDDKSRLGAGEIVRCVGKHSTDRFTALASEFLPFVFFAQHDEHDGLRKVFEEVWNSHTGGSRAAVLYLDEIARMTLEHLKSASWNAKHAAALTLATAIAAVSAAQGQISESQAKLIWPGLKQALAEKTWAGKEKMLEGLVTLVQKADTNSVGITDDDIVKIVVREASRRNFDYQSYSLASLAQIASSRPELDLNEKACEIVERDILPELVKEESKEDKNKKNNDEQKSESSKARARIAAVQAALAGGDPADAYSIRRKLDLFGRLRQTPGFAYASFPPLFRFLDTLEPNHTRAALLSISTDARDSFLKQLVGLLLDSSAQDVLFLAPESIRLTWSKAALSLANTLLKIGGDSRLLAPVLCAHLQAAVQREKVLTVRQNLTDALHVLSANDNKTNNI